MHVLTMLAPFVLVLLAASPPTAPSPVETIVGRALTDGATLATVTDLADRVGQRLSGSDGAAEGVRWAVAQFQAAGVAVRTERLKAPHWIRGEERGEVLPGPGHHGWNLALTALGGSAPTPPGGLEAEVVEIDKPRRRWPPRRCRAASSTSITPCPPPKGTATPRSSGSFGPAKAAARGAVATMVRSAASASLRTPHTGVAVFEASGPAIPAVALATEDAAAIHRWLQAGPVRVRLQLGCRTEADVESANVVA